MRAIFSLLALIVVVFLSPLDAAAQGAGSLLAATQSQQETLSDVEAILDSAAQKGVGVVVIDSEGNVISQPSLPEEPAQTVGEGGSTLMQLQDDAVRFRSALLERVIDLPNAWTEVLYILRAASPDGTLFAFTKALVLSLILFGIGGLFESYIYGKRLMAGPVQRRIQANPQGYIEKMPFLVFRFMASVGGILVSIAVAYLLGTLIFGALEDSAMQFTVTLINIGYFTARVAAALWRMILSPFLSQYRIPALNDRDARKLHRWLWMVAMFDIVAILFGIWIGELGLNYDIYAFFAAGMSAIVVAVNILMVLVNHRIITGALRNGRPLEECSLIVRILCKTWAPLAVLYVIFAWVELTYDLVLGNPSSIPLIAGAYGILLCIIVVYGVVNFVIERSFARARHMRRLNALSAEEDAQAAALAAAELESAEAEALASALDETREEVADEEAIVASMAPGGMTTFEELARRVAGILAFVAGAYAFFYIWDNDSAEMVESYADRMLDIMVIVFIGYIVYHAFRIWIDSKIAEESVDEIEVQPGDEGGVSNASRLATLLPLFRNFILIVVTCSVGLIILMEVGVNVGPLFAGAGIVGIAIGFGSQALVRDVFAGAFFLLDDAFRKGEYLDVGGVKGTVEKISVRSFQLRHHLGALHTIPFGELQVMTNYSRDWVIMKLPLRVTYDTDVEKVRKLIKKLGQELLEDPVIGDNFIQPLKSQGVIEMQDSAMIIRVKFMTKPGDQWLVRKRVYEEIRVLFEREDIKFAHREVTVRLADGKVDDLTEEQKREVAAAAHASIEEDMLEEREEDNDNGP